ncbi:hypothetical protein TRVL_05896 [Trypanosoma vivax]|nr:hypothetical protein TRVL_05896 [Trypanosoma vivax]
MQVLSDTLVDWEGVQVCQRYARSCSHDGMFFQQGREYAVKHAFCLKASTPFGHKCTPAVRHHASACNGTLKSSLLEDALPLFWSTPAVFTVHERLSLAYMGGFHILSQHNAPNYLGQLTNCLTVCIIKP